MNTYTEIDFYCGGWNWFLPRYSNFYHGEK